MIGYCSIDGESDPHSEIFATSDSLDQCKAACDSDELCIAFDRNTTDGNCYKFYEVAGTTLQGDGETSDW